MTLTSLKTPTWCQAHSSLSGPEESSEALLKHWFGLDAKSEWFPYLDKALFLMDLLFSSPRLKFSRAQQKAILSWVNELGATVPSYKKFQATQTGLLNKLGNPTSCVKSGRGNVYYLNEIGDSIAKDMANPISRPGMVFYLDDSGSSLSQTWNADKMLKDVPDHLLTPMIKHQGVIYYVNELVQCKCRAWFIPNRWITKNGSMYAVGYFVTECEVCDALQVLIVLMALTLKLIIWKHLNTGIYPFSGSLINARKGSCSYCDMMPHPLWKVTRSHMVYSVPLVIFQDDVSGNQSKQWNKHYSCYLSNGMIPCQKLESEFHVHFVAMSPTAFASPVVAWDCQEKEEVLLRPYALLFPGDNPMQAEFCSSAGLCCNHFCRTCRVGGSQKYKQSDEGFSELLKNTLGQLFTALQPSVLTTLMEAVHSLGTKDALTQPVIDNLVKLGQQLQKNNPECAAYTPDKVQSILTDELKRAQGLGHGILNPLIDMDGVDIHKDTPTEILHTILLGITIWILEKAKQLEIFQAQLNSIVTDSLNVPKLQADYMCQYKGGLIGKHFKTISQVMAFAVYDIVPKEVLEAWLIIRQLTVLLWHTEIKDIESYMKELDLCINDFLNITCKCSPSILITKPKFHFLVHLSFYICCFGPALLFSTECYEAYNAVFCAASVFSNWLAPSRDIAWSFAGIDRVKHIVTGGCQKVLTHILEHPEHASMVGLPTKQPYSPGEFGFCIQVEHVLNYWLQLGVTLEHPRATCINNLLWDSLRACKVISKPVAFNSFECRCAVIASSGEVLECGGNAIIRVEGGDFSPLSFGIIREITCYHPIFKHLHSTSKIQLAKQKPPPGTAEPDPTLSSNAMEAPLTAAENNSTTIPSYGDDQLTPNQEGEAPPLAPLFSHCPKEKPQKGKVKQSTQAMYTEQMC
ncbi:hypothetical protein BJV74DRAFT_879458 [Russula compacta]|nr:hypothetical protein BJV74DRAFT_879458 [Russula compacta]